MSAESTRSTVIASLVIHVVVFGLFAILITVFKRPDPGPEPIEVVFYKPGEYVPPAPAPPVPLPEPEIQPEPEPEPAVEVAEAKPDPKPEVKPKPAPVRVAKLQPPPEPIPEPEPEPAKPKRPRREVKTNLLNAAVTKPATKMPTRQRETTTGSFGEREKGAVEPRRPRLRGGTRVGNFAVADTPQAGKAPGREVVKTSGFGSSDAKAPARRSSGDSGDVKTGGFGSTATTQPARSTRKTPTEAPDTPVEVISKATPIYTSEARELRIEGEVTLRVTFAASGKIEILEVLDRLGHGLDEAAIDAAKRIRFKPARREGRPVDHTAVLRIVFQLV